jgi:hypothetical protein
MLRTEFVNVTNEHYIQVMRYMHIQVSFVQHSSLIHHTPSLIDPHAVVCLGTELDISKVIIVGRLPLSYGFCRSRVFDMRNRLFSRHSGGS